MDLKAKQVDFNQRTRDLWESYASHRRQVTRLAQAALESLPTTEAPRSLCVLGSGNGNDLDLEVLAKHFQAIHLFDLDEAASQHLRQRYQGQTAILDRLHFESAVDITGVQQQLEQYKQNPNQTDVDALAKLAKNPQWPRADQKYDVVLSCCILTQLYDSVLATVGEKSSNYLPTMFAIREGHLRLIMRLLKAYGRGLLVTDFVSSDTLPELNTELSDQELLELSRTAINERNFFTGGNPFAIKQSLESLLNNNSDRDSPALTIDVAPPWKWQLGARSYLATALGFSCPQNLTQT